MPELNAAGKKLFLADYAWDELERIEDKTEIKLILPVGSIEEHGYHLPLRTDILLAAQIAARAARSRTDTLVLPELSYGYCMNVVNYCGTLSLSADTLINTVCDIVEGLYRHGFRKLVIYNGHGGNCGALDTAQREALRRLVPAGQPFRSDFDILLATTVFHVPGDLEEVTGGREWGHACQVETSAMLALAPELVDMSRAVDEYMPGDPETVWRIRDLKKFTASGVHGTPTLSSAAKGEKLVGILVGRLGQLLEKL
ncbi:creatininase family protein [bacterium]|nr:creatininase family protein [bacterium]